MKEKNNWEVWDLDSFVRQQVIKPDSDWLRYSANPQLDKVAGITAAGDLLLKDLVTGKQSSRNLNFETRLLKGEPLDNLIRGTSLRWGMNGADFLCSYGWYRTTDIFHVGRSSKSGPSSLKPVASIPCLRKRVVSIGDSRQHHLRDISVNARLTFIDRSENLESEIGKIFTFDVNEMKHFPPTDFSVDGKTAKCRISPNGELIAVIGSDAVDGDVPESYQEDFKKIRVCDVETGKVIKSIKTGHVHELFWSPDSSSLIVSTVSNKEEKKDIPKTLGDRATKWIEDLDANQDGILSVEEAKKGNSSIRNADKNKDGNLSVEELVKRLSNGRWSPIERYFEMETIRYSIETDEKIEFRMNTNTDEGTQQNLCFQRGSTNRNRWGFAKPRISGRHIAFLLFDASTIRNGERLGSRNRPKEASGDFIGFFDIQSGKLEEVVDLQHQFKGRYICVSEDWILVDYQGERVNLNTFAVLDRKHNQRLQFPNATLPPGGFPKDDSRKRWEQKLSHSSLQGAAFLAPKQPHVALLSKDKIECWTLDPNGSPMKRQSVFTLEKSWDSRYVEGMAWHPSRPVLGWVYRNKVFWYDAEKNELFENDSLNPCIDLKPTESGWIAISWNGIIQFDNDFKTRKTYLPTMQVTDSNYAGSFDQCITANGEISNPEGNVNLRAILLKENRFETRTIEEFEK